MALTPTIYKFRVALSDLDRQVFESLNLTVARHPSETTERMLARLLAFCLNAQDNLAFGKGLSNPEEPDLWARDLHGACELWIDVGEPVVDRVKKAGRQAREVKVYSFNSKSDTWWEQNKRQLIQLGATYYQFPWPRLQALAGLVEKTVDWSVTITENTVYVAAEGGDVEVLLTPLKAA